MGSGKTTTGMKLAGLLGWSFTDLDRSIEESYRADNSRKFFPDHGEEWFRKWSQSCSESFRDHDPNTVISTGGGTPCYGDNMDYMLETGLTLYLKLTPAPAEKQALRNTW